MIYLDPLISKFEKESKTDKFLNRNPCIWPDCHFVYISNTYINSVVNFWNLWKFTPSLEIVFEKLKWCPAANLILFNGRGKSHGASIGYVCYWYEGKKSIYAVERFDIALSMIERARTVLFARANEFFRTQFRHATRKANAKTI